MQVVRHHMQLRATLLIAIGMRAPCRDCGLFVPQDRRATCTNAIYGRRRKGSRIWREVLKQCCESHVRADVTLNLLARPSLVDS
eukprot:3124841-Alexandrium_andersonii.AAC.2